MSFSKLNVLLKQINSSIVHVFSSCQVVFNIKYKRLQGNRHFLSYFCANLVLLSILLSCMGRVKAIRTRNFYLSQPETRRSSTKYFNTIIKNKSAVEFLISISSFVPFIWWTGSPLVTFLYQLFLNKLLKYMKAMNLAYSKCIQSSRRHRADDWNISL